jgi:methanogenic corrinoid protein MtbC1
VTTTVDAEVVNRFDRAVADGDRDQALTVVEDLVGAGVDPVSIMVDLVAAVQRRVGQRWADGSWSVAQEHAATGIATSALEAVSRLTRGTVPERGRAVVACAEHEWHALPAMLVSNALRTRGWHVTMLGASTPTARLNRYLQDLGPDVTAVSCSVPAGLPNSRGFIEASTTAGIPVLAGGAAFGPDARRASALGATAWAPDARRAVEVVEDLPRVVRAAAPLPASVTVEQSALQVAHRGLLGAVSGQWAAATTASADADDLRDAVDQTLHAVSGTLLTGDERLLHETSAWVDGVLNARGFPGQAHAELGTHLLRELRDFPLSTQLLRDHWQPRTTSPV